MKSNRRKQYNNMSSSWLARIYIIYVILYTSHARAAVSALCRQVPALFGTGALLYPVGSTDGIQVQRIRLLLSCIIICSLQKPKPRRRCRTYGGRTHACIILLWRENGKRYNRFWKLSPKSINLWLEIIYRKRCTTRIRWKKK